jgi:hypothetical protein
MVMTMATTYTIDPSKGGTVLQSAQGGLQSIQMVTAPTGSQPQPAFDSDGVPIGGNYLCFVDASQPRRRVLFAFENGNAVLGGCPGQSVNLLGAAFNGNLVCTSCPAGASYSLVVA